MTIETRTAGTATIDSTQALHLELDALLETAAHLARSRFGGSFLVVDRTASDETGADIKLHVGGVLVDLWELDPLLWDDAHWAGIRSVEPGQARLVMPVLHRA
jgi:hypothetical protein